jgi:hypothetical protein
MNRSALSQKNVTLLDLLDRMLDKGVVLTGDITISVANIDLVYVGLKVLLSSVETMEQLRKEASHPAQVVGSRP